jgi:hypothetical protein
MVVAPLVPNKEIQAFVKSCEHLISAIRTGTALSKEEYDLVQFYLSEILTVLKDL